MDTPTAANVESVSVSSGDKTTERPKWSGKLEFLMSCISISVGLGNVWRFPFTAYENGGGVFLIPYIIVLFLIGKPMYYMEALLGQFSSKSSVKIWSICPAFLGVGIGEAYASAAVLTYYSSLISLTVYYLIASFQSVLPWAYCRDEWSVSCVDSVPKERMFAVEEKLQSSSELYFTNTVLREIDDISDGVGTPSWRLLLTLLFGWIVTFAVLIKGIQSLGKASYFLALFPYVVLIALLVRAVTLEGAGDGIIYFLKPEWDQLLNIKIWKEAVVQCFFSLSVSFGPIITFSSYNKFDHNVYRDAMIVTSLDTLTSLLAGITIFGILGNLAFNLNAASIDEVVRSGTGLAFISYPDAIAKFQAVPQVSIDLTSEIGLIGLKTFLKIFAVLFFFMLFVLGVGSLAALTSTVVTILSDQFKIKKFWSVALTICVCGFCVAIVYTTPGGQWILNLVDYFAGTFVVFFLAIFEIIGIMWIYGVRNFCDDVEFMTNRKVSIYWRICWLLITPLLLLGIFIYTMVTMDPLKYGGREYPDEMLAAGWVILAIGFVQFPLWAIWHLTNHKKSTYAETLKWGIKPSSKWGPMDPEIKSKWLMHKQLLSDQRAKEREIKNLTPFKQNVYYLFGMSK